MSETVSTFIFNTCFFALFLNHFRTIEGFILGNDTIIIFMNLSFCFNLNFFKITNQITINFACPL